jgi:hypothetical protein
MLRNSGKRLNCEVLSVSSAELASSRHVPTGNPGKFGKVWLRLQGAGATGRYRALDLVAPSEALAMWRSLFLALGVASCVLGAEALFIDQAVLKKREGQTATQKVVDPPEWAPWSLMAGGAVVVLYSFTIPRRVAA